MLQGIENFFYSGAGTITIFVLIIVSMLISVWAQIKVKSAYSKYSQVRSTMGVTGAQAARRILDENGLYDVDITEIGGTLSDNYNPKTNTISLSSDIYRGTSVAAVGIAAHEVGHAIQHAKNYLPVKLRTAIVPVVNFSSNISWILILIGLFINSMSQTGIGYDLAVLGVVLFSLATVFQLITLPVELNASNRAKGQVAALFAPSDEESKGIRKVLSAAALTYVAALIVSIANLLRVMQMVGRRRN